MARDGVTIAAGDAVGAVSVGGNADGAGAAASPSPATSGANAAALSCAASTEGAPFVRPRLDTAAAAIPSATTSAIPVQAIIDVDRVEIGVANAPGAVESSVRVTAAGAASSSRAHASSFIVR